MATRARYTVLRKLADGGMAEIYLGTQHGAAGFERPIVIKRIRADFSADKQFRLMMLDEAHIAMGLNHSNIVQVLDLGTSDGAWFMVLEMVDGWDVDTLLRRARTSGHPLPASVALHIVAEICRALAYAHSRTRKGTPLQIVHRDVSPENILVSEHGEVKLADFGIATAINKQDRTSAGVVKGKLGFMSPEQANGLPIDGRSDVYALGSALYVMATDRRPFQGKTELEVLLRQQEGAYVPLRPDIPDALARIIRKAMERDLAQRYLSADDMLRDIEAAQRKELGVAGQTELKQWLAELASADGDEPTSRRTKADPKLLRTQGGTELEDGSALILEEVEETLPPPVDSSPPLAALPPQQHVIHPRRTSPWLVTAGLVTTAAAASMWWVSENGVPRVMQRAEPLPPMTADQGKPVVSEPRPWRVTEPAARPPGELPDAAVAAETTAAVEAEVDESGAAVRTAAAPVPTPGASTSSSSEGTAKAAPPTTVSVRFASEPPGATVVVNSKVFGTTPMSVRFKPGLMHDVVFHKDGFVDQSRRVYVSPSKNQSVQVTLARAQQNASAKKNKWWPF